LFYLALSNRPHSRSALAGLLWGGKKEADARRNLRVELSKLRQVLADYLTVTHTEVAFNREHPYHLDVEDLREATRNPLGNVAATKNALTHIRGELLEDLQVYDAPEFETWLTGEQEEIRRLQRGLLQVMVTYHRGAADPAGAVEYAQALVDLEPWREESHRVLMELFAQQGYRAAALAQYEKCRKILSQELGVEPMPETQALAESIRKGLAAVSPSEADLGAIRQVQHNLPVATTTFIGRGEELKKIRELLIDPACRLLTLLGPGGTGKSRLALEAGQDLVINPDPGFLANVTYVSLADAHSEADIISALILSLNIPLSGLDLPKEQLFRFLADRQALLILDNFEHLVGQSGFVLDLLAAAAQVKCLVTSRERLPLMEGWNLDLSGLDVPAEGQLTQAFNYSAVQLFIDRARRLNLGFNLDGEMEGVVRICRLVDGLPLGIELAAGWVRGFSCRQIAQRIQSDLATLQVESPSLPERQRSLVAAFQHSWQLLSKDEQQLFARLSLFHGGFSDEAARAVTGANPRQLLNLVDKSLVRRTVSGRYELHPLLGQLAKARLVEGQLGAGQLTQLQERYADYYVKFLGERRRESGEVLEPESVSEITADLDNIRIAWRQTVAQGPYPYPVEAVDTLARYYQNRCFFKEGATEFEIAAGVAKEGSYTWALLRARQAQFFFRLGRNREAVAIGQAVLPVLEEASDSLEMARCLLYMGNAERDMGEYRTAEEYYSRSASLFSDLNDVLGIAAVENNLGVVNFYLEELEGAIKHFEEALEARRRAGVEDVTLELGNIGLCLGELGRYAEAAGYLEESLALATRLDSRLTIGLSHHNLGNARRNLGQREDSAAHIEAGIRIFRELGSRDALAAALADLASTYLELNRLADAEGALQEGLRLEIELNRPRGIAYKHLGLGNLRLAQENLADAQAEFENVIKIAGTGHGYSLVHNALAGLAIIKAHFGERGLANRVLASIERSDSAGAETLQMIQTWRGKIKPALDGLDGASLLSLEEMVSLLMERA